MTLSAGDYFPGATIMYQEAGSTVAIAKGALLKWDTSGDGWITCSADTLEYGPFAVCVEAMSTGGTQVKVCTRGLVAATCSGALEPNDLLLPSSSTAGRVMVYAAQGISGATSNVIITAQSEFRRVVGRYISDNEDLGDGTIAVDAAAGDVVIIDLASVGA